jgi:phosphonate transport system permease protein
MEAAAQIGPNQIGPALLAQFRRRTRWSIGIPVLILLYLSYAALSFDLPGLAARFRPDSAAALLSDFWSYQVYVTRDNRNGKVLTAIDGDPRDAFPPRLMPTWIQTEGEVTTIDLGRGTVVTYQPGGATMVLPGYGTVGIRPDAAGRLQLTAPQPLPDWISASEDRVGITTPQGRFTYTKSRTVTQRTYAGWEEFFFTLDSPFAGRGVGELVSLALWQPRLDPAVSNIAAMADAFWHNRVWHHADVFAAMLETVLMAFLGTMTAALIALPLSFMAASNMMPLKLPRFALRRVFDFIRGTDALIWTLILVRAFGPGPMTGALAITMTDTGAFGKLFSEALENIDEKQVEGVRSTGASAVQRARFGVIPQVMPVLLSQVLYHLESNTRSATVIGAIVGGGIGLLLTQAIQTQKDWEDVAYYLILVVLTVMAMDWASGVLRRKLIKGE